MRTTLSFPVVSRMRRICKANSERDAQSRDAQMKSRIVVVALIAVALALLSAVATASTRFPAPLQERWRCRSSRLRPRSWWRERPRHLAANVLNDKANAGVNLELHAR